MMSRSGDERDDHKAEQNCRKVRVNLKQRDGWPPTPEETLWVCPSAAGFFRVDNIPFFAEDLNLDDIVAISESGEGLPEIVSVVKSSGHTTFRVLMTFDEDPERHQMHHMLLDTLRKLECSFESHTPSYFAIDVPPEADCARVFATLQLGNQWNVWAFEGACPHTSVNKA